MPSARPRFRKTTTPGWVKRQIKGAGGGSVIQLGKAPRREPRKTFGGRSKNNKALANFKKMMH